MILTFLGTGTSHGVPVIGCDCPVCKSDDQKDKRYRSSLFIESEKTSVVIDTGYEFRLSMLRSGKSSLDGVIYTHAHSDHIMGLDDLRVFTHETRLNAYSSKEALDEIEAKFPYAFSPDFYGGLPNLNRVEVKSHVPFSIGDIEFTPFRVIHGQREAFGYVFDGVGYVPDVSDMLLDENRDLLENLDILIIGALRRKPHPTHLSFDEAYSIASSLRAKRIIFTHINHDLSYRDISFLYQGRAESAYDTLSLEV